MSDIYQDIILELYKNPMNRGRIQDADLHSESYNKLCGDRIEVFITTKDGKVGDVKFEGKGCAISQASASLLTENIKGRTLKEVGNLQKEDVLELLGIDLSKNPSRLKCALLGLETVKKAIRNE